MASITVLGTGEMGSRMATNFAQAGHNVTIWNRTQEAALSLAGETTMSAAQTPSEAVKEADVVVSMLADDAASREVWLDSGSGALNAMKNGAVAVESSTITPTMARELAAAAEQQGVPFLEAPVVGSRPQADAGGLFYLIGGDAAVLESVRSIIGVNAGGIRHMGAAGDAATMKLAINGLFGIQVAAYAEIVGLLSRSTVETQTAIDLLAGLPITSPALQRILALYADRDFAPNFPVRLVAKDFGYLTALADELNAAVPVSAATSDVYSSAQAEWELDIAGIANAYLR